MFEGFILSSAIRDSGRNGTRLSFQGRLADGRRFRWTVTRPRLCFFVEREAPQLPGSSRKPLEMRTLRGRPVDVLYFQSSLDLARARRQAETAGIPTYESDISAPARHLMERGIKGGVRFLEPPESESGGILEFRDGRVEPSSFTPVLRLLSLDVEGTPKGGLFSIALYGDGTDGQYERVFQIDPSRMPGEYRDGYEAHPDERTLLSAFLAAVRERDPDALIGWNVINFDLRYLAGRCAGAGLSLDLGVDGPAELIEPDGGAYGRLGSNWLARVPGRAVLDGINMLKAAFVPMEGYSLAAVSSRILGRSKLIELEGEEKMAEIERRFREEKESLARYNLQDAVLVHEIFAKLSLSQLAVRKAQLTGLSVDRMGGSVAALDFLYLPALHRRGYVADTGNRAPTGDEGVPGGLVLEGVPGIHRNVLVLDFKSLYPSIIRTFMVDPLAAAAGQFGLEGASDLTWIKGPAGPVFARELAILPGIVEGLMEVREEAKRSGDQALSQAVKIIMNSFYGVLGNPASRFFHPDLAGAITRTGQWVLLESKRFLEGRGYRVLYGDTDSLFVHAPSAAGIGALRATGAGLAAALNLHLEALLRKDYAAESRLAIQFEKVFLRFFMPALRREERGSKKRYAGLLASAVAEPDEIGDGAEGSARVTLHFTGLESARSDWTRMAKDFQGELLSLVFRQEKVEESGPLEALARDWNRRLMAGELDDWLVYSKGLSKDPGEYTGTAPPHVRAARLLDRREGRIIRYVMTVDGPEPVQKRSGARPDYRHYAEKQLAPIADMVLRFYGTDFETATKGAEQLSIFRENA